MYILEVRSGVVVYSAKKIIYTGAFRFPNQDAAAIRVLLVAKCLRQMGYDVEFLSWAAPSSRQAPEGGCEGFSYVMTGDLRQHRSRGGFARLFNFLFLGRKALRWLIAHRQQLRTVHAVFVYNPPSVFAAAMLLISRIYRFKLVLDSTEWYESEHLPGGRYGVAAIENFVRMHCVYPRFNNIFAISTFLEKYYKERAGSANIMRVPAMADYTVNAREQRALSGPVSIIYAGNAGKKDNLLSFLRLLPRLNALLDQGFRLHLYGPEREEIEGLLSVSDSLSILKYVVFHGRVSPYEVQQAYAEAQFSIIFRDSKRYALAGFPTKAVESWSSGVPLITNAVGDLALYCKSDNSVVVDEDDMESELFSFFSNYDYAVSKKMASASVRTAERYFCWLALVGEFENFMHRLR